MIKPVTGPWRLSALRSGRLGRPANGLSVFSCFHGGGGSTMGYKLAGFSVLGGVEIDPKMMELYRRNHGPKHSHLMGIQEFTKRGGFARELLELDVLDGSPPCSSFSLNGNREKDWGKERRFREGQALQRLDDLFFDFIALADALRPRFVVAENVKGLIVGLARGYVAEIFRRFAEAGYDAQLFLLNGSRMGIPQLRERTFFLARRRDLALPAMALKFEEPVIGIASACKGAAADGKPLSKMALDLWRQTLPGFGFNKVHPRKSWFAHRRPHPDQPLYTLIAGTPQYHWAKPRYLSAAEVCRAQGFPDDYDFGEMEAQYVCGMSVPPLMMQRVAMAVASTLLGFGRGPAASRARTSTRSPRLSRS